MAKKAAEGTKPKTLNLSFGEDDEWLYNHLTNRAKSDRRTPSQWTLMYLLDALSEYKHQQTATSSEN